MTNKIETISVRVSPKEKEIIKAAAAAKDMTVSKYLYRLIFGHTEEGAADVSA